MGLSNEKSQLAAKIAESLKPSYTHLEKRILPLLISDKRGKPQLWEAAKQFGARMNEADVTAEEMHFCREQIGVIRSFFGRTAEESDNPTTVVFGTSGWRGIIGQDFHLLNVHKVIRGIIAMMQSDIFLDNNGYHNFKQVQEAGILVFRDNRFMGERFMEAAMRELAAAGIRIYDAGECPTGVGSALLVELNAAGSINFTPSHNPMEYAGVKFNPSDGGPADKELTALIENEANRFMQPDARFEPAQSDYNAYYKMVDAKAMFTSFVRSKSRVFKMSDLRNWLLANRDDCYILVDNMHGASRGFIEHLLGDETTRQLQAAGSLQFVHTEDDYAFHGLKPEPSPQNQNILINQLRNRQRRFTLAVALDPDGDRIRYADADMDIDMNRFGAIAYSTLLKKGFEGGLASTAPSSDFALEIARRHNQPVYETAVGFKHFRSVFKEDKVIMAFEESDGISFMGHTLEKCALAGFLAAIDAMAVHARNLSQIYNDLREQYGYFYPGKAGDDVQGVSVEAWQNYKKNVLETLQNDMFKEGDVITIGDKQKTIQTINTIDGIKLIFNDKSWILLRPSGTEPKFRYYFEIVSDRPLDNADRLAEQYKNAAADILKQARTRVDNV